MDFDDAVEFWEDQDRYTKYVYDAVKNKEDWSDADAAQMKQIWKMKLSMEAKAPRVETPKAVPPEPRVETRIVVNVQVEKSKPKPQEVSVYLRPITRRITL